jgi:hypothetical protein
MPANAASQSATSNPYGTYTVQPTPTGIRFQVSTQHPHNKWVLTGLIGKSFALAWLTYSGFWNFLGALMLFLILDVVLFVCIRRIKLIWVEVRPDGLAITPEISMPDTKMFFDRRAITQRQLDFDAGFTFRYGIFDVQATQPFADDREFEIFQVQFEQAISRLWHQQNL